MAKVKASRKLTSKKGKRIVRWTSYRKAKFLTLLALAYTVEHAAKEVGLSRRSAYQLRERDDAFAKAWEQAYEDSTERLEAEAYQRAIGREEVRIDKDGNAHHLKKYSDLLMIFLLKARKPGMYREKIDLNINERRHIRLELIQLEKDEKTGRLVMVEENAPPRLTSGEG